MSVSSCVIVCFLTAPQFRNQSIACALLSAACEGLCSEGMQFAEANPRPDALGAAANHFGPLHMYLAAGFAVDRADSDGSVWVRKKL